MSFKPGVLKTLSVRDKVNRNKNGLAMSALYNVYAPIKVMDERRVFFLREGKATVKKRDEIKERA